MRRQGPAADRPGDDPCQVQDPHPAKWPLNRPEGFRRCLADLLDFENRQVLKRPALRMRGPLLGRPHHRGDQTPRTRLFGEGVRLPTLQGGVHCLALIGTIQQFQNAVAVVGKIRMYAHPTAIAAAIGAGDLVPDPGRAAVFHPQVAFAVEFHRRVPHVDREPFAPCRRASARTRPPPARSPRSSPAPRCRPGTTTASPARPRSARRCRAPRPAIRPGSKVVKARQSGS